MPPGPNAPRAIPTLRPHSLRRRLIPFVVAVLLGVAVGVSVGAMIHMPKVESLIDFRPSLVTRLLDRDGKPFASYARERRELLGDAEVPPLIQKAVVASEDSEFFRHGGIDAFGALRSVLVNLQRGRRAQGASTITMQLAKMLYLTPEKSWRRKVEQVLLAVDLEKNLSKQQVLALYCNLAFLGHGNYGMEAAARYYFGKPASELSLPQAATLAGMVQRPSAFSPYRNPAGVTTRRNYVLGRMLAEGFVTREEHDRAVAEPLAVQDHRARSELGAYFAEDVRQQLEAKYGTERLYQEGLQVRTTLDSTIQRATEESLRSGLLRVDHRKGWRGPLRRGQPLGMDLTADGDFVDRNPSPETWLPGIVQGLSGDVAQVRLPGEETVLTRRGVAWTGKARPSEVLRIGDLAWFRWSTPEEGKKGEPLYLVLEQEPVLEGAAIVLESATGAVRAMVGGWDFQRNKFNRVTQAQRQVGSAFKPFVYGAALESGFSPADTLFDAPAAFAGADGLLSYSPRNYYRRYYGIITLRRALELSVNVSAVKLMDMVGVQRVVDFARRAGLRSALPPYPSLALGSADLLPIELAAAYASVANQGIYLEPYFIDRVSNPDGLTLQEHQTRARKVTEPEVAYVLTHMLEGVVDRGTAGSCADLPLDLAGKTGTTNDYTDAWFVGFTPRYTILSWVGYDQKRTIGRKMTGAEAALPIWRLIVERGLADGWLHSGEQFSRPPGVVMQSVEYWTGLLPGPGAEKLIDEAFLPGTVPTRSYQPRWQAILALPWAQQRPFYQPRTRESMPEQVTDWSAIQQAWENEDGD